MLGKENIPDIFIKKMHIGDKNKIIINFYGYYFTNFVSVIDLKYIYIYIYIYIYVLRDFF